MAKQWTCQECGRTHQLAMLTCDHGGEVRFVHRHEWTGYETTGGVSCQICGQRPPSNPSTFIYTLRDDDQWSYT